LAKATPKIKIPEAITKYIAKDAPKDARLLAAKGTLPMAPLVQITVFTFLSGDSDVEVSGEATKSLLNMPADILKNVLSDNIHPKALDFFAKNKSDNHELLERILLNKITPDESFVFLADKVSGKPLDILSSNQQRMLRTPKIASLLKKNPNAQRSTIERIISFLRISGVQIEGESPILTQDEINMLIAETTKKRDQIKNARPVEPTSQTPSQPSIIDDEEDEEEDFYSDDDDDEEFAGAGSFDDDDLYGGDDLFDNSDEISEEEKMGIAAKIEKMTVPQKVKVALVGNKEVRGILIKDSNKIVAMSVIKSPKIMDSEVYAFAQMRSLNDEIIRFIANNKEWIKKYSIKLALTNNPKTPLNIGMKFMNMLNSKDIGDLARNKNVSPQLQKLSKERFNKMRGTS